MGLDVEGIMTQLISVPRGNEDNDTLRVSRATPAMLDAVTEQSETDIHGKPAAGLSTEVR